MLIWRIIRFGVHQPGYWFEEFTRYIPSIIGVWIRRAYWRRKLLKCGGNLTLGKAVTIEGDIEIGGSANITDGCYLLAKHSGVLTIGKNISVSHNTEINASDGGIIVIGDDVLVGASVVIRASSHKFDRIGVPIRKQGHTGGSIIIDDDVWIGANAVILPGVHIGRGVVVGAGAVVTSGSIKAYDIVGGVPAKIIGSRVTEKVDMRKVVTPTLQRV